MIIAAYKTYNSQILFDHLCEWMSLSYLVLIHVLCSLSWFISLETVNTEQSVVNEIWCDYLAAFVVVTVHFLSAVNRLLCTNIYVNYRDECLRCFACCSFCSDWVDDSIKILCSFSSSIQTETQKSCFRQSGKMDQTQDLMVCVSARWHELYSSFVDLFNNNTFVCFLEPETND